MREVLPGFSSGRAVVGACGAGSEHGGLVDHGLQVAGVVGVAQEDLLATLADLHDLVHLAGGVVRVKGCHEAARIGFGLEKPGQKYR